MIWFWWVISIILALNIGFVTGMTANSVFSTGKRIDEETEAYLQQRKMAHDE